MDRLTEHLDRVGGSELALIALILGGLVFTFIVYAIPTRFRTFVLLALLSFCQTSGNFESLGLLTSICKFAVAPLAVYIACVSLFECRARIRFSSYFLCWIIAAAWAVACVIQTPDASIALPVAATWFLIVIAAGVLSCTLTSQYRLELALKAICLGAGAGSLIALFALVGSSEVSKEYIGRFSPFGANPNQIAMSFVLVVVFSLNFSMTVKGMASRIAFGLLAVVSSTELVLTLSRAAIGIVLIALSPLVLKISRYPFRLMLLCILSVPVVFTIVNRVENVSTTHLSGSVDRVHHWELGLQEIEKRPIFGLLGKSAYSAIDKGWNAHNAFIQLIYTGGLSLAVPVLLLYSMGLYFGVRVYLRRESVFSKSVIGYLVLLQLLLILHGFVNDALFYPTYTSSFIVIVLCFFFYRLHYEPSTQT